MSMIRLSLFKDHLFAPTSHGSLEDLDYNPRKKERHGRLEISSHYRHTGHPLSVAVNGTSDLDRYLAHKVAEVAANLSEKEPVTVMVNGFLFDPRQAVTRDPKDTDNPHGRIFHFNDNVSEEVRHHTTSWPLRLGFQEHDRGEHGLAVAFGWYSQPGFASSLISHFENFYARAYDLAEDASWPLLRVLRALSKLDALAGKPIDIFCHSLGSVVVIRALATAAEHDLPLLRRIGRVIVLGGSEYCDEARTMYSFVRDSLQRQGIDQDDEPCFYNIVSRENAVLDILAENFGPRGFFSNTQVIGHNGLKNSKHAERWIDLQIDGEDLTAWLREPHGLDISGDNPGEMWDHWYYYTHRGNMDFYTRILRDRADWSVSVLRDSGCPEGASTGWFGD